jgi:hypothetical protein
MPAGFVFCWGAALCCSCLTMRDMPLHCPPLPWPTCVVFFVWCCCLASSVHGFFLPLLQVVYLSAVGRTQHPELSELP